MALMSAARMLALVAIAAATAVRPVAAPPTPVIVELFTSEGCESCPPADVLLQQLASTQPVSGARIIPLSLHVDYWDQLGWKDRFSSAALTNRQRTYGARFNTESVYTPQMVVDGRSEFVGSDAGAARKAIARAAAAAHGAVRIDRDGNSVTVVVTDLPPHTDRADIVLALTEDHLKSNVTRGENHGRTLAHTAVVRHLETIGEANGSKATANRTIEIDPAWKTQDVRLIAFVQERRGGAILASGSETLGASRP